MARRTFYHILMVTLVLLTHVVTVESLWSKKGDLPHYNHGVDLPTKRPLIIAHRGSSGVLPEHTIAAYRKAVEQGADIIECDLASSRDLVLVCLHSPILNSTTNVAEVFPERQSTYYIPEMDGNVTGYFSVDFTLEELRKLRVRQQMDFRDQRENFLYPIPTLEEHIKVARSAGRPVGIYPETKLPAWVNSLELLTKANTTFERLTVDAVTKAGYTKKTDPCFLQSFDYESLKKMHQLTELPLIILHKSRQPSDAELSSWANICYGLGPNKNLIVPTDGNGVLQNATDLVARAHKVGLKVHPYTFRNEDRYLGWAYEQDPYNELRHFLDIGIDGYFTEFPDTCVNFLNTLYSTCPQHAAASALQGSLLSIISILLMSLLGLKLAQ